MPPNFPADAPFVGSGEASPTAATDSFVEFKSVAVVEARVQALRDLFALEGPSTQFADALGREIATDPHSITVVVAEAEGTVVSAGWIRYLPATGFASLWGGSTLAQWRSRCVPSGPPVASPGQRATPAA